MNTINKIENNLNMKERRVSFWEQNHHIPSPRELIGEADTENPIDEFDVDIEFESLNGDWDRIWFNYLAEKEQRRKHWLQQTGTNYSRLRA